jgi:hypothetical protein
MSEDAQVENHSNTCEVDPSEWLLKKVVDHAIYKVGGTASKRSSLQVTIEYDLEPQHEQFIQPFF